MHSLLFATTNHIGRLDPALSRPGRMDVWVNFTNATKWQAEGIFKCFFPYKSSSESPDATRSNSTANKKNLPVPREKFLGQDTFMLSKEELDELAKRFAASIPEDELSVGLLQLEHL
jgi:mitochondrial chaperone BCS1